MDPEQLELDFFAHIPTPQLYHRCGHPYNNAFGVDYRLKYRDSLEQQLCHSCFMEDIKNQELQLIADYGPLEYACGCEETAPIVAHNTKSACAYLSHKKTLAARDCWRCAHEKNMAYLRPAHAVD